jgi:hypothetical protein
MIRTAFAVYFSSLVLWVGGLTALSFVVAPTLFRTVRPVAGEAFGGILRAFGYVEMACAGLLAVASVALFRWASEDAWMKVFRLAAVGVMLILTLSYTLGVNPAIAQERARIPNFASLPEGDPAKARFDRLHRWSVRLAAANLLVGWALVLVSAANLKAAR